MCFGQRVNAGAQTGELECATAVGRGDVAEGAAEVIRPAQRQGDPANGQLTEGVIAIVVKIEEDRTIHARGGNLAKEIVFAKGIRPGDDNTRNNVVARAATKGPGGVYAIQIAVGLGLDQVIRAGWDTAEAKQAIRVRGGRQLQRCARLGCATQQQRCAWDAALVALLCAIVAVIPIDIAHQARARFTKVVAAGILTGGIEDDGVEAIIADDCAGVAVGLATVAVAARLRLGYRVSARAQVIEVVEAVAVGRSREEDGLTQVIGAGQHYGDIGDTRLIQRIAAIAHAVVVDVFVDQTLYMRGCHIAKVVVDANAWAAGRVDNVGDDVCAKRAAHPAGRAINTADLLRPIHQLRQLLGGELIYTGRDIREVVEAVV